MIIKKFVGKTEEEAVEAAKKELGSGIVIMNVKNVKKRGIAGWLWGKQVEVTVALEEDNASLRMVRREPAKQETVMTSGQESGKISGDKMVDVMSESSQNIEKKLDSLQTLLENRLQQTDNQPEVREEEKGSDPEEEKGEKQEEIGEQEKFIRLLYNTMLENEVDEKYANQIIDDVEKNNNKLNLPFDYILANVYQKMILQFGRAEGITESEKQPKTLLFMGPTGVGKTTTIAKIASHYCMEEKKKIVLLTADTYRIAAAEQLRTYANILEVPFRVIYTEEEAKTAIQSFRDCDYIFIDTAGHSHQNEELLENMGKLLAAVKEVSDYQTFLVLSATTKYKDLLKIASNYKKVSDYQLIFTKLDETTTLGNLLNIRLFTDAAIAYVTCGQNVPDDIEEFNPKKTVKQLLKKN